MWTFCSEGLPNSDRTKEVIFFHRTNLSRNSVVTTGKVQITNVLGELHLFSAGGKSGGRLFCCDTHRLSGDYIICQCTPLVIRPSRLMCLFLWFCFWISFKRSQRFTSVPLGADCSWHTLGTLGSSALAHGDLLGC